MQVFGQFVSATEVLPLFFQMVNRISQGNKNARPHWRLMKTSDIGVAIFQEPGMMYLFYLSFLTIDIQCRNYLEF